MISRFLTSTDSTEKQVRIDYRELTSDVPGLATDFKRYEIHKDVRARMETGERKRLESSYEC